MARTNIDDGISSMLVYFEKRRRILPKKIIGDEQTQILEQNCRLSSNRLEISYLRVQVKRLQQRLKRYEDKAHGNRRA